MYPRSHTTSCLRKDLTGVDWTGLNWTCPEPGTGVIAYRCLGTVTPVENPLQPSFLPPTYEGDGNSHCILYIDDGLMGFPHLHTVQRTPWTPQMAWLVAWEGCIALLRHVDKKKNVHLIPNVTLILLGYIQCALSVCLSSMQLQ